MGFYPEINHPAIGVYQFMETPHMKVDFRSQKLGPWWIVDGIFVGYGWFYLVCVNCFEVQSRFLLLYFDEVRRDPLKDMVYAEPCKCWMCSCWTSVRTQLGRREAVTAACKLTMLASWVLRLLVYKRNYSCCQHASSLENS